MNLANLYMLTVKQFCEMAHITRSRFDMERRAGRIIVTTLGIRSIRIPVCEYQAWQKRLKTNSAGSRQKEGAK